MEKLDVELEVIKCKIHEEDLQQNFKEELEEKLNNAYESNAYTTTNSNRNKNNVISRPFYFYKAAAVFVCFVMFSSCAFAGGVGDWLKEMFCNVDTEMEVAYENGELIEVETEYQTYDGVSVKVDYVSLNENELYLVFNIKAEENFKYIDDIIVENENGKEIFDIGNENLYDYKTRRKSIDKTNKLIFLTAYKNEGIFENSENLNINIKKIQVKEDRLKDVFGDWKFEINLNN